MGNNSEFEIARWEYEGGSIGREKTDSDEPVPAHNTLRFERQVEGVRGNPARHGPPRESDGQYLPCSDSLLSLHELRCRNYELPAARRILAAEIRGGGDSIGALIMGHKHQCWWTGSVLAIDEARGLIPKVNATAVQVAAGVLAGTLRTIRNPRKGIGMCFPDDLPHDEVLGTAEPYLGNGKATLE
jgi:hypothetical protein